uniref:hypothetical protein n=1 Tax=Cyathus stercoreus TaxID=181520 RepID=UPI002551EB13|nr:hypothetical protein QQP24_mgp17 [Cyathus stercoreus]WEV87348.1 hypothetical protein [Cyathus stercoreus]
MVRFIWRFMVICIGRVSVYRDCLYPNSNSIQGISFRFGEKGLFLFMSKRVITPTIIAGRLKKFNFRPYKIRVICIYILLKFGLPRILIFVCYLEVTSFYKIFFNRFSYFLKPFL